MRRLAAVLVLLGVFVIGLTATAALANPEEACEKWPNNKQCNPTTTAPTEPPTTTEPPPTTTEPPPTTTEPPPTTTEEEPPPPNNNGGTTGGSEPPTTDLPLTGLDAGWIFIIGLCLLVSGSTLFLMGRPGGGPLKQD